MDCFLSLCKMTETEIEAKTRVDAVPDGKTGISDRDKVSSGYNKLTRDQEERKESVIEELRRFNNWVKSVIVSLFADKDARCMDLCSGKGGDMSKWGHSAPKYVTFVDRAYMSVVESVHRYNKYVDSTFRTKTLGPGDYHGCFFADFVWADAFHDVLMNFFTPAIESYKQVSRRTHANDLPEAPDGKLHIPDLVDKPSLFWGFYDFVQCQFAMHYAFETEERARMLFQNVASSLKPGAFFVATVPNRDAILSRVTEQHRADKGTDAAKPYLYCGSDRLIDAADIEDLAEGCYGLRFEAAEGCPEQTVKMGPDGVEAPDFGARYLFRLVDAIDSLPEYLLPADTTLRSLAGEYGLELVDTLPFGDILERFRTAQRVLPGEPRDCPIPPSRATRTITRLVGDQNKQITVPYNQPLLNQVKNVNDRLFGLQRLAESVFRLPSDVSGFDPKQWAGISLYKVLVFRRRDATESEAVKLGNMPGAASWNTKNFDDAVCFRQACDIVMLKADEPDQFEEYVSESEYETEDEGIGFGDIE